MVLMKSESKPFGIRILIITQKYKHRGAAGSCIPLLNQTELTRQPPLSLHLIHRYETNNNATVLTWAWAWVVLQQCVCVCLKVGGVNRALGTCCSATIWKSEKLSTAQCGHNLFSPPFTMIHYNVQEKLFRNEVEKGSYLVQTHFDKY